MERNIIEIRHGQNPPKAGDLEAYELGFCENTEKLYIGAPDGQEPILIGGEGEGPGEEPTVECLPLEGGTMLGNIDMGEKRIKNLADPIEAGDAVPLRFARGAFAPAGYGLGENIGRYCADCHDTSLQGGLYYVDINTANCIGVPSAPLLVQTADSTNGKVIYLTLITGANVVQCYYSAWSKAWQPWEWLNPPMSPDVEYRTAERWNGSAVYAKFLNCGMIPNSSTKSVDTGIPKSSNMIIGGSFSLINTPKTYLRTEAPDSFDYVFDATSTTNYFVKIVTTASGYSDYTAYLVIKYVKI